MARYPLNKFQFIVITDILTMTVVNQVYLSKSNIIVKATILINWMVFSFNNFSI